MKKTKLMLLWVGALFLLPLAVRAQTVAVYPMKTEGFEMNKSQVLEMHRIAMQACYDAGLRCAGRGETADKVQREQQLSGKKQLKGANYVAECVLIGKTEDKFNAGTKKGGLDIFGGVGKKIKGNTYGGVAGKLGTSGLRFGGDGMDVTCQFSDLDGFLVYSEKGSKLGLSGEIILGEAKNSNTKKIHKAFEKIFNNAKAKLGT